MHLILASKSPRRKALLEMLGIEFATKTHKISENPLPNESCKNYTQRISLRKAELVNKKISRNSAVILGADTAIEYEGAIIGKPQSKNEAVGMLSKLSGQIHTIFTSYTLIPQRTGKTITRTASLNVHFRTLSKDEIIHFVNITQPLDKAGGYALQEEGQTLVQKVSGDLTAAIGLPVSQLILDFRKLGIIN